MLILTRRFGDSIMIDLEPDTDPTMLATSLFAAGPIVVTTFGVRGNQIKIGVAANKAVRVLRQEIYETRKK